MKKKIIKGLSLALIGTLIIPVQVSAYTLDEADNSEALIEYQDSTDEDFAPSTNVFAQVGSLYKVTIPKVIVLSGITKKAGYYVNVEGDLAPYETVYVVPESTVNLHTNNKAVQVGVIAQDRVTWTYSTLNTKANGQVVADGIDAGKWSGIFWFNLKLDKVLGDVVNPEHVHNEDTITKTVIENKVEPTCTKDGSYDEVLYCKDCNEELSRSSKVINALGHDWDEGVITTDSTCTNEGIKTYTCNRCGTTKTETISAPGHMPKEAVIENKIDPTCTKIGGYDNVIRCSRCNEILSSTHTDIPKLGHDWNEGVITVEPKCMVTGIKLFTCHRCNETKEEILEKLGHNFIDNVCENCNEVKEEIIPSISLYNRNNFPNIDTTGNVTYYYAGNAFYALNQINSNVDKIDITTNKSSGVSGDVITWVGDNTIRSSGDGRQFKQSQSDEFFENGAIIELLDKDGKWDNENLVSQYGDANTSRFNPVILNNVENWYLNKNWFSESEKKAVKAATVNTDGSSNSAETNSGNGKDYLENAHLFAPSIDELMKNPQALNVNKDTGARNMWTRSFWGVGSYGARRYAMNFDTVDGLDCDTPTHEFSVAPAFYLNLNNLVMAKEAITGANMPIGFKKYDVKNISGLDRIGNNTYFWPNTEKMIEGGMYWTKSAIQSDLLSTEIELKNVNKLSFYLQAGGRSNSPEPRIELIDSNNNTVLVIAEGSENVIKLYQMQYVLYSANVSNLNGKYRLKLTGPNIKIQASEITAETKSEFGNDVKFVVEDENFAPDFKASIIIPDGEKGITTGKTYEVKYSGARIAFNNEDTIKNYINDGGTDNASRLFISAIIYDTDGNIKYYGPLKMLSNNSNNTSDIEGICEINIPVLDNDKYYIAIFEEQIGGKTDGNYETDYISGSQSFYQVQNVL